MIMARTFTITSYGKTKEYPESQRKKMIKEFETAMLCCDGSEAERYRNIYGDLVAGEKAVAPVRPQDAQNHAGNRIVNAGQLRRLLLHNPLRLPVGQGDNAHHQQREDGGKGQKKLCFQPDAKVPVHAWIEFNLHTLVSGIHLGKPPSSS